MAENKTKPPNILVDDFLKTVSEKRQNETHRLIEIMQKISGEKPVMWGSSIIGFGSQHYKSEAGREGDMPILAFSPRKAKLTIYFYEGYDRYGQELASLGKHTHSASCLYINKLEDIDLKILKTMLESSYKIATESQKCYKSVDDYTASIPEVAQEKFDQLRKIVKAQLPNAHEVISYGILGYKPDLNKRAVVFISGWRDHVAIYPVPKDEKLRSELRPYIKGKGTLWFSLDQPLPKPLIQKTIKSLSD